MNDTSASSGIKDRMRDAHGGGWILGEYTLCMPYGLGNGLWRTYWLNVAGLSLNHGTGMAAFRG